MHTAIDLESFVAAPGGEAAPRPRVLLIGEALAISHVARPAVLAAHLHRQGYDVALACDPRYNHLVSTGAFRTIKLNAVPASLAIDRLAHHEPVYDVETLDRYVQEDIRMIRDFEPQIVVGDHRHSLAVSSQLTGVTYINIADAHWSPATAADFELPNSPLPGAWGASLSSVFFQLAQPAALAVHTLPLNTVQMKYGLPGVGPDIKRFYTCGDYTVYPNDPALFSLERPLPANHRFLGPLDWSPRADLPEWWDALPDDRPLVYVSLGSTGPSDLLETIIRVLAEMPVTAIVSTAGRRRLPNAPANVWTADFLPGADAARRSRLVICNGGTMSGQQALSAGTPYLAIVSNMDQLLFSKSVRRTGACEWIRAAEVVRDNLRALIRRMLDQESYRTAAMRLAARAAKWDACAQFEALVSTIIPSRKTRPQDQR